VARILMVGGGCRGRRLAAEMIGEGHTVRATTRDEAHRPDIEATGAECWIGTPDRLATLRGALDNVTIACWLLATAKGTKAKVRALHSSRLEFFLSQAIDTTIRGFVYESAGTAVPADVLGRGEGIVRVLGERNAIPVAVLSADPDEEDTWIAEAGTVVRRLLGGT
jgi:hypothetical protein